MRRLYDCIQYTSLLISLEFHPSALVVVCVEVETRTLKGVLLDVKNLQYEKSSEIIYLYYCTVL